MLRHLLDSPVEVPHHLLHRVEVVQVTVRDAESKPSLARREHLPRRKCECEARVYRARTLLHGTERAPGHPGGVTGIWWRCWAVQRAVLALNFVSVSARPDVALCSSKICCIRLAIAGGVLGTSTDVHSARRAASRNMDRQWVAIQRTH